MRILIVDDDRVDREHIKRIILKSNSDCEFVESTTVDDALEQYRSSKFDLVLLDYRMPRRDGIEMLIELQNEPVDRGVAVIMLSNSEDEELALKCVRAGAHDFLIKADISTVQLRRAIYQAQARYELEQKLYKSYRQAKQLAEHDSLTGLANRFLFEENLKISVTNNRRDKNKLALLLFDIDHFKYVNDSHGHDVGDQLLQNFVARIQQCLRGNELFARLGGDEFAILLTNIEEINNISKVAQRILGVMKKPFQLNNTELIVGVSIGIAIHPDNSDRPDELFKYADIAMYRAKHKGRNTMVYFEGAMQKQFLQRYKIEHELRAAIESDQFVLYYQPVFEPGSQKLTGFEALIRWKLDGEIRMPDEFISIAEDSGQIRNIGRWVIDRALAQLAIWSKRRPLKIAINLSAVQLRDEKLIGFIGECLEKYEVDPENVEFELTETAFIEHTDQEVDFIRSLNQLGCRIALDDFGIGYSSVSHIHKFPISTVKIDKSLMMGSDDLKTLSLIRGLTVMIHSLGLDIVAEGVESEACLKLCDELKVHWVQGYYFTKPLAVSEIEKQYLD